MVSILVAGDTVVDGYPDGRLALGEDALSLLPGGTGANVAIGLARLYDAPRFHTALASDRFADELAANLRGEGIDDDLFRRVDGQTSLAVLDRAEEDIDWTIYHEPATLALDDAAVPDDALAVVDRVHVTGIPLGDPQGRDATVSLARRASRADCTVTFDLNGRDNMWTDPSDYRAAVESVLEFTDVAFASDGDLAVAGVGGGPIDHAAWLHERGIDLAFVTLGADGALASDAREPDRRVHRHGGFDVDAINPAGAGDAFAAGVLGGLGAAGALDAVDPADLLAIGNAAGALAATADSPTAPLSRDGIRGLLAGDGSSNGGGSNGGGSNGGGSSEALETFESAVQ